MLDSKCAKPVELRHIGARSFLLRWSSRRCIEFIKEGKGVEDDLGRDQEMLWPTRPVRRCRRPSVLLHQQPAPREGLVRGNANVGELLA